MKTPVKITLFVVITSLLTACQFGNASPNPQFNSIPQAWIDAPLNGSTLPLGPVEIISHGSDLTGIAMMELSINGQVIRTDANSNSTISLLTMHQLWEPTEAGVYEIGVRAQTPSGEWSAPALVTVTIVGETVTPSTTPPPSATPTPVSTFTPSPTPTTVGPLIITLTRNSFCRSGPAQVFRDITAVPVGDSVEVRGISSDSAWLFVLWPKFNVECWIVAAAAPPDTNLTGVEVLASPPTPTSTIVAVPVVPVATTAVPTAYKP